MVHQAQKGNGVNVKILDQRNEGIEQNIPFQDLRKQWVVEGTRTGTIYYVVSDTCSLSGKRLVNISMGALLDPIEFVDDSYRLLRNVSLVIGPQ